MKLQRIKYISAVVCIIVVILIVSGVILWGIRKNTENMFYANAHAIASNYPTLSAPFSYAQFYYKNGTDEYMVLQNDDKCITGKRKPGETPEYYMYEATGSTSKECTPSSGNLCKDSILEITEGIIDQLCNGLDISYSLNTARGSALPHWVGYGEKYLVCQRPEYEKYREVIAVDEVATPGCVRWYILDPQSELVLYLHICSHIEQHSSKWIDRAWGELPDCLQSYAFDE